MTQGAATITLPPLTRAEISKRDVQEAVLGGELSACWSGDEFDEHRAVDLLRAYVVDIFELHLDAYRADMAFGVQWIPTIITVSVARIERCFANHYSGDAARYLPVLLDTLREHLKRHHWTWWSQLNASVSGSPPTLPVARPPLPPEIQRQMESAPALPSPLLLMAQRQADASNQPTPIPQDFVQPSLGQELKRLLVEARIRPEDIAEEIGIEARNVYRHLAGTTTPSLVNLGKYEKALTKHLGRLVKLPISAKRHNVSSTSVKRQ